MLRMKPISVIVPAYNEEHSIGKVVDSIKAFMSKEKIEYELIVVDDCSKDDTVRVAKNLGVTVISHPVNTGYGASLTTGIKKARHEQILIIDADGTYPVTEVKKLLPYVDDFDMVVGARQGKHYHGSLMKRLSRAIFYLLLNYVTAAKVPDANSGLRIFKKSVVMQFEDDFCNGFSFTTTITLILLSNDYLIKFVPVEYNARTGKSKVKYLRDTARTVQILLHTITYYNPIKAFLPFSVISLILFLFFTGLYIFKTRSLFYGVSAVISFFSSMVFMGLGMVSYAIVKRGIGKE